MGHHDDEIAASLVNRAHERRVEATDVGEGEETKANRTRVARFVLAAPDGGQSWG